MLSLCGHGFCSASFYYQRASCEAALSVHPLTSFEGSVTYHDVYSFFQHKRKDVEECGEFQSGQVLWLNSLFSLHAQSDALSLV